MSKARDVVNSLIGGNHPPAVWSIALDALVAETRAQALADADQYLTRLGYGGSAYLLRSTDVPVQG